MSPCVGEAFSALADTFDPMDPVDVISDERDQALRSLRRKRGFRAQVVSYVVINVFLWLLWFATGGAAEQGYWPAWVSAAWGVGLAFSAWHTYGEQPISESDIDAELSRMSRT